MRRRSGFRMPGSLLTYVVCLTLVPMLGFGVYAGLLVGQGQQQDRGARQLGEGRQQVADVDAMRAALTSESISNIIPAVASSLGVSYSALAAASGSKVDVPAVA